MRHAYKMACAMLWVKTFMYLNRQEGELFCHYSSGHLLVKFFVTSEKLEVRTFEQLTRAIRIHIALLLLTYFPIDIHRLALPITSVPRGMS